MKKTSLLTPCAVAAVLSLGTLATPLPGQQLNRHTVTPVPVRPLTHPSDFSKASLTSTRSFYTSKGEWQRIIDSTWGPGLSTALELQTFDTYWNKVDQTWGGFPNLAINWDSLRSVYRPLVAAAVSRGRFYGILSRLTRELNEWHVYLKDDGIDAGLGLYSDIDAEYPNWPSFRYQAGVPILNLNAMVFRTPFGAGVTPLPDGSAMVYSVMTGHPLGLKPGDIILGYDGVPWKRLIRELFDAELPVLKGGRGFSSSTDSYEHLCVMVAGMNWGLFDTIDVAKYPGNDTLHYPTSLLKSIPPPYFIATEQLPVPGVFFPDLQSNKLVSWGVVQGTSIGYVYAWDWSGVPMGYTKVLFGQAVDDLMHTRKVQGLILDFRTNFGGWPDYANDGFKHLFNADPTSNYGSAYRVPGGGHFDFTITTGWPSDYFTPTPEIFDHPIAVLTGPGAGSSGDYNAFRMRFHPMVRFFGKPTVGAYTDFKPDYDPYFTSNGYAGCVHNGCVYSRYNNEGYMIHKTFPVDEEVWLTRDGVAKGKDDVVERALAWITSLTYAHDVALDRTYSRPGLDSVRVTATLANPLHHAVALTATVTDTGGGLRDSVLLYNDGLHGDGAAGDTIWGCRIRVPADEGLFGVSVRTEDLAQATFRRLPNAVRFATAGPLTVDNLAVTPSDDGSYMIKPYIKNNGASFTVPGVSVTVICTDSSVESITPRTLGIPLSIPPGGIGSPSGVWYVYPSASFQGYFNLKFDVASNGYVYWTDARRTTGIGVIEEETLPVAYALDQNYPNPFNPKTGVRYQVPGISDVKLVVYDLLGREVAVLLNEKKSPGTYELQFDGSGLASGVYIYRLTAGSFVASRRMVLLK
jgi:hypothetical protein